MIKSIQIKNFKSVVDLTLDIGNFNILIGENGCGKSNILEAIAFGAAASANKLDFEFLGSRGVRVTNPEFMYSAFSNGNDKKKIKVFFELNENLFESINFILSNDPSNPKKWINLTKEITGKSVEQILTTVILLENNKERRKELKQIFGDDDESILILEKFSNDFLSMLKKINFKKEDYIKLKIYSFLNDMYSNKNLSNFIIYSPEQTCLRKFEETNQIYPLGIRGEGLFQYLKELSFETKNKKILENIKQNLSLLDWYESFDIPKNTMQNEFSLKIKDKYINPTLKFFDQRSTNEGFLYLLFYSTLFISKGTPSFFAVDNIDTSLNPKLCYQLTKSLASLSKKHKKQVIITTQNPAILDGLDLKDDNQRLFVIRRNGDGHTIANRIAYKPERKLKLSEVWTNGFIGGLPENF